MDNTEDISGRKSVAELGLQNVSLKRPDFPLSVLVG